MRVPTRKSEQRNIRTKTDYHITQTKFNELNSKLNTLKNFSRPKVSKEVAYLAQDGDFSENAGYQMAKGKLRGINNSILKIEDAIKKAVIIKTDQHTNIVQLGHSVKVRTNNHEKIYTILGSSETNPTKGIISQNSPLGSALLGRKVGEEISIVLANKQVVYKIIEIIN